MLILVVEDTPIAQKSIKIILSSLGHEVSIADTGEDAVEMADKTKYDIIFMDIGLGEGINGFEATAQIKKANNLNESTPVVALTAHDEPEFVEKVKEVGMVEYFNKPMTPDKTQTAFKHVKP